jgi:hypothetical protein
VFIDDTAFLHLTFADPRRFRAHVRALEGAWQWQIAPAARQKAVESGRAEGTGALNPAALPHLTSRAPYAGAGGARSRAVSDRMSTSICRDTTTSHLEADVAPAA